MRGTCDCIARIRSIDLCGLRRVGSSIGGAVDDTDALDEARSAFYAAASSAHWRVYDWYVDKILDDALEAGALLADA